MYPDEWPFKCFQVTSVCAGLVGGATVYGHWRPPVHLGLPGEVPHGWVVLKDGRIFDPTRWAFETKLLPPYLYIGPNSKDYKGTEWCSEEPEYPPRYDKLDVHFSITKHMLDTKAWIHIEKLLRLDAAEQMPGFVTWEQLHWLAHVAFETLQPHAAEVYKVLERLNLSPLPTHTRAEQLYAVPNPTAWEHIEYGAAYA